MSGTAPVVRLTAAFAGGVGLGLLGAPVWSAPLVLLLAAAAPIRASFRRSQPFRTRLGHGVEPFRAGLGHAAEPFRARLGYTARLWIGLAAPAGILAGVAERTPRACEAVEPGRFAATGYFETGPRSGAAPFRAEGLCVALTAVVGEDDRVVPAGRLVRLEGQIVEGRFRPWIRVRTVGAVESGEGPWIARPATGDDGRPLSRLLIRWREGVLDRVFAVHGSNAGMVAALVLARREGLEHEVRDDFAAAGIAHLLAISGFHVGVMWGLVLAVLRGVGTRRRGAEISAIAIVWLYVGLIGVPDAAARAALILTTVALGRAADRPPTRWGGLATAALLLLLTDPGRLGSAGFQLSFAGAAGLTAWSRPWREWLDSAVRTRTGRRPPKGLSDAVVAGCAATLATLPIAAWHFERVSVVGIPVTLAATPLVTLALPGAILSLLLSIVSLDAARFLAGGTGLLLEALAALASGSASLPGATTWIDRGPIVAAMLGVLVAIRLARAPGVGAGGRRALIVCWALIATLSVPVWQQIRSRGSLELRMIDVGQGDALLVRSPAGRSMLIDAGRPPEGDPRAHPVVRELRRAGVLQLEWLLFTHADADHFGGGEAVLDGVEVRQVLDPALPVGKSGYLSLLQRAAGLGIPWLRARSGQRLDFDGVQIDVLHPSEEAVAAVTSAPGAPDANEASLIVSIRWKGFSAVVTGDAYVDAERTVAEVLGDVDVLKVGHHGSRTSTAADFLDRSRPEWALISVGARNRYGHPAPDVIARLEAGGAAIRRTDEHGTVRVLVHRSGRFEVLTER